MSELEEYIGELAGLRSAIRNSVEGLEGEALNWRPPAPETNSVYAVLQHAIGGEERWVHQVIGGRTLSRDRAAELASRGESLEPVLARMQRVAEISEEVLRSLRDEDLGALRPAGGSFGERTVRWCLLHLLEHYSEHKGHIDLTRQLWEARSR